MVQALRTPLEGVHVWQAVELGIPGRDALRWYRTRVEECTAGRGEIVVGWPMVQLSYVSVHQGDTVYLGTPIANDALYIADCLVVRTTLQPRGLLTLVPSGEWRRMQRREHVRVEVSIVPDSALRLVPASDPEPFAARILDLSASGTRLRCDRPLSVSELVALTFALPGFDGRIEARAEVRRCWPVEHADPPRWDAGCRFTDLGHRERERLVRFVFARQRELARWLRERP